MVTPLNEVQNIYLTVGLPVPLRQSFDYRVPENYQHTPQIGMRVEVKFGNRTTIGVITNIHTQPSIEADKIKPAIAILDTRPVFTEQLLALCEWAARYYHHPFGEVLFSALPQRLRQNTPATKPLVWVLSSAGQMLSETELKRAPKQLDIIQRLKKNETLSSEQSREFGLSPSSFSTLQKKGFIEKIPARDIPDSEKCPASDNDVDRQLQYEQILNESPQKLNVEQEGVLNHIRYHQFCCYLLEGATGSGKTEVYLQMIARVLQTGKQVLVLIPEIGLTPQTLKRFQDRFCVEIAELHSEISETKREKNWNAAREGSAKIVIGTRLAAFTPLPKLGAIIVDEEHDISYKQQDGFKYSARDISVYRAKKENIPIVLGSATPSLESFKNAIDQRYEHLRLTKRAGGAEPPVLYISDLRKKTLSAGLSPESFAHIDSTLAENNQVLIFVNRRGYAPALICHYCGWTAECRACDSKMTIHQSPHHLRCHHCDSQARVPISCPECKSEALGFQGFGTEQCETELTKRYPDYPVVRIDRDSTRAKGSFEANLDIARSGKPCILVGTQMLAKGHHLPNIALVIIVDADQGLLSPDFRGAERMGQLITQVAGRAGREHVKGHVLIQTHRPEHPLLELLLTKGYHLYARKLLEERTLSQLPPSWSMAVFKAESKRPENAIQFLMLVDQKLKLVCAPNKEIHYLGPIPAAIEKVNNRYRFFLQVKSGSRTLLQNVLNQTLQAVDTHALAKRTRWSLDIDPLNYL